MRTQGDVQLHSSFFSSHLVLWLFIPENEVKCKQNNLSNQNGGKTKITQLIYYRSELHCTG